MHLGITYNRTLDEIYSDGIICPGLTVWDDTRCLYKVWLPTEEKSESNINQKPLYLEEELVPNQFFGWKEYKESKSF